jgi:restriction system protein
MTSIADTPSCSRCGEIMVLKTAERGSYAGQQFWACPRFPQCWGKRGIRAGVPAVEPAAAAASVAGASAQAEFERRSSAHRERVRRLWPMLVGITLVFMLGAYLVAQAYVAPAWAGLVAMVLGGGFVLGFLQLPQTTTAWSRGAEASGALPSTWTGWPRRGS